MRCAFRVAPGQPPRRTVSQLRARSPGPITAMSRPGPQSTSDNVDECLNQIGDAPHNGCPPPVIVHDPGPTLDPVVKIVERTTTAVQPVAAPTAAPAPAVAKPVAPGRVTGLCIRKGRITGTSPVGANQVRIAVRRNGRNVSRIGLHVSKAGQRFSATFPSRARGLYTVRVVAANELGSNVAFGATTSRSFRLR